MDSKQKKNNTSGSEDESTLTFHMCDKNVFASDLEAHSRSLLEHLESKNYKDASHIISNIIDTRDQKIFSAVGQLTRALHEAIVNFNIDESNQPAIENHKNKVIDNFEIQDASDRLNYVISLTRKAADKTMDMIEESAPIAADLGDEAKILKEEWIKLRRREVTKNEFTILYQRVDGFLDSMCTGTEKINSNLQTILVEQGFQDLTGQVLTKVISLVKDVESELVNLVRMAGQVEQVTGIDSIKNPKKRTEKNSAGEGPQIHAEKRDDVMNGQDDVDDLLSILGF